MIQMNTEKTIELIRQQIQKAEQIIRSQDIATKISIWDQTNLRLLRSLFNENTAQLYLSICYHRAVVSDGDLYRAHRTYVSKKAKILQEILTEHERFASVDPTLAGVADKTPPRSGQRNPKAGKRVFIVHGRDDGAKETVARFIQTLGLEPVVLHEKPNKGRTIIEKFEDEGDVAFAVALFTPDDVGALKEAQHSLAPRARQNVVLEFGFFLGRLSRSRTCALIDSKVERPSDYDGVVFIPFNDSGSWQLLLAKELRAAGIDVDLNRLA